MKSFVQTVRIESLAYFSRAMNSCVRDGQMEAAKVWVVCRDELKRCIEARDKWPNRDSLQKLTKGRFGLHSQSAQMVCHAFLANVDTARQLRLSGRKEIRYPYRDKTFYPLYWPAQAMCLKGDRIILPMGRNRQSIVLKRPEWLTEPSACKIVWNGVHNELHITVDTAVKAECIDGAHAAVDLGQIHQCAVTTNTGKGLIVSGRGIRAEKQRMNKMHGALAKLQSRCKKGSRRWKKLQRSRNGYALRSARRIRDMRHKGTRQVIDFCQAHGVSGLYVGNPDGVRTRRSGRKHNQRMSQWEYGKDIDYLTHKSDQAGISSFNGTERGTSSHCPICGRKHKPSGRNWSCKGCGFSGHRDLVGSINMHKIAFDQQPIFPVSKEITYLRPGSKYGKRPGLKTPAACRSNRPDTGHVAEHRDMSLHESMDSTTESLRAPQGAGLPHAVSSEALSL